MRWSGTTHGSKGCVGGASAVLLAVVQFDLARCRNCGDSRSQDERSVRYACGLLLLLAQEKLPARVAGGTAFHLPTSHQTRQRESCPSHPSTAASPSDPSAAPCRTP